MTFLKSCTLLFAENLQKVIAYGSAHDLDIDHAVITLVLFPWPPKHAQNRPKWQKCANK
jgi:hypothetical protein